MLIIINALRFVPISGNICRLQIDRVPCGELAEKKERKRTGGRKKNVNETGSGMKGEKIDFPVTCDLPHFETGENRPLEFYIEALRRVWQVTHKVDYIHAGAIIYSLERIVKGTSLKIVPVSLSKGEFDRLNTDQPPRRGGFPKVSQRSDLRSIDNRFFSTIQLPTALNILLTILWQKKYQTR